MPVLVARVRKGKVIRTINKRTVDERIIELRKALNLNLRQEAKAFSLRVEMRKVNHQYLSPF